MTYGDRGETDEALLNEADPATFYASGPQGYTDYPQLAHATI